MSPLFAVDNNFARKGVSMKNFKWFYVLLTITQAMYGQLYGQDSIIKQSSALQHTSATIILDSSKKAQKEILGENEYWNYRQGSTPVRALDKPSPYDYVQIRQLERSQHKKAYDELYNIMLKGLSKEDATVQTQYHSLLTDVIVKHHFNPESIRMDAWQLASAGYTLTGIQEFFDRTGISLLEVASFYGNTNHTLYDILLASTIVIGTIDSMQANTKLFDGNKTSFFVTIKQVLKGDKNLRQCIIRDWNAYVEKQDGYGYISYKSNVSDGCLDIGKGEEYILFLYKNLYEFDIERFANPSTSISNEIRQIHEQSYVVSQVTIPTTYPWRTSSYRGKQYKTAEVKELCQKYIPLILEIQEKTKNK